MQELKKNLTEKSSFKLQQVMDDCLKKFRLNEQYHHISLHLIDDLVSPLFLKGDGKNLMDALDLLLINGATMMKASKINIYLKQLLKTHDEVLLEFTVESNCIRDCNYPAEISIVPRNNLEEVKKMIESFGGKVEISTLEGLSTTVKFLVKFYSESNPEQSVQVINGKLAGRKILVAEDNEINQKIISHLLKRENIVADIANDGKEAIELFEKKQYDLVLLDLQMPHMDGFQTAKYIRKILRSNVPIVAMTAGAFANEQTRCFEIGINQYLSKPFTPVDLFQRLNYLLLNEHNIGYPHKTEALNAKTLYNLNTLRQINDDEEIIEILEMFVGNTPLLLREIKQETRTKELSSIIKKTAKLKGSLGSLQMHSMIKIVEKIEGYVRLEDPDKIPPAVEQLQAEYDVIAPALTKELSQLRVATN